MSIEYIPTETAAQPETTKNNPLVHLEDVTSLSEAARTIGVTPMTLWNWVEEGRLPYKKLHRCTLVHLPDVLAEDARIRSHYTVRRTFQPGYKPPLLNQSTSSQPRELTEVSA